MSERIHMVNGFFVLKFQILCCSDHPMLFKFRELVVNIVITELPLVYWTFTVSNSNGNMEELERKI